MKYRKISYLLIILVLFLFSTAASLNFPPIYDSNLPSSNDFSAFQNSDGKPPIFYQSNNSINGGYSIIGLSDIDAQGNPDWERIIKEAYESTNTPFLGCLVSESNKVSCLGGKGEAPTFLISYWIQSIPYTEYQAGGNYTEEIINFHSYTAKKIHSRNIKNQNDQGIITWGLDDTFFIIGITSLDDPPININDENLFYYAEALYAAATGSSPAPPASSPTTLPESIPDDICASINCASDYCSEDGSQYLYDCTCDPADGQCYTVAMMNAWRAVMPRRAAACWLRRAYARVWIAEMITV